MQNAMNAATNFFNQNLYGFLILLLAAFFYYINKDVAAATFVGIGAALMGVRQPQQQPPNTQTTTSTVQLTPEAGAK
ncbi:MAG TPA: hypothetical protein VGF75_02655 [Candidatus Saccharimonadales bacterium]|jgi:hypothetical protein